MFPLSETGVLGDFWGRIKGDKYRLAFQDGTWDIFCPGQLSPDAAITKPTHLEPVLHNEKPVHRNEE